MKKLIVIAPYIFLAFSIVGCGGGAKNSSSGGLSQQSQNTFKIDSSTPAQSTTNVPISNFSMNVNFSKPIDSSLAYLDLNAQTSDTVIQLTSKCHGFQPININVSGSKLTVTLYNQGMTLFPADMYTLTVLNTLKDSSGDSLQVPPFTKADTISFSTPGYNASTACGGSGSGTGSGSGSGSGSGTGSGGGSGSGSGTGSGSGSGSGSGNGGGSGAAGLVTLNFQLENPYPDMTIGYIVYSFGTQSQASGGTVSPNATYNVQNNAMVEATQTSPAIPAGVFSNQAFTYQVYYPFQSGTTYYLAMKACTTDSNGNPNCSPFSNECSSSF